MNNTSINEDSVNEQRPVRREKESVDDFEHLGLDNSPTQGGSDPISSVSFAARDMLGEIDKMIETSENVINIVDAPLKQQNLFDTKSNYKMDTNLFEMGDTLLDKVEDSDDKMDNLISQLTSYAPPVPSHEVSPIIEDKKPKFEAIHNFLEMEREIMPEKPAGIISAAKDLDFNEPAVADLISNTDLFEKHPEIPVEHHFDKQVTPVVDEIIKPPAPTFEPVFAEMPAPKVSEPVITPHIAEVIPPPKPSPQVTYSPPEQYVVPEPTHPVVQPKLETTKPLKSRSQLEPAITDAEAIFKKMGLVESLIYWRDPAKSGPVFGGVLIVLLALTYLSLISVVAYLSLLALTATISFRIYKNVVHAVQKTGDGHPFKDILDMDISLPQEKVKEIVETAIAHVNAAIVELRRLFLVDDLVDSIKFGVLLWCLTYLGAWFNGMTLVIIAWVALFTLPKVYETNKTQIDANLDLVRSKIAEITSKVKAAIPIGKKVEDKKDQ